MSKRANPTVIGVFVVGAVVLAVAAILVFGSGRFFQERERFVIYFDQSVMGLTVGSPVIFQGVSVGSVSEIYLALGATDPPMLETPVIIELIAGTVRHREDQSVHRGIEGIRRLVAEGMRAQLNIQSLVTGGLYVDLVIVDDKSLQMHDDEKTKLPEIPSIPSGLKEFKDTLLRITKGFEKLPLDDVAGQIESILTGLDKLLNDSGLENGLQGAEQAIQELRGLIASAETKLDDAQTGLMDVLHTASATLETANGTLQDIQDAIEPGSPVEYEVRSTLEEVRRTTRQLGTLLDELSRRPDALIFGLGKREDS